MKLPQSKGIELVRDPEILRAALNPLAWKILNLINERPYYPNEIAKKLRINEQNIYYHIRNMQKSGLIECISEEKKRGAVCKYFVPTAQAFGIELSQKRSEKGIETSPAVKDFFFEFTRKGVFDGKVVVGAPTPHGPHLTEARDGHYAVHLGFLLGSLCSLENRFVVALDIDIKAEKKQGRNMILIGGPVTNIVSSEVNNKLDVRFVWNNAWQISSLITKKSYAQENCGLIAKVRNPWDKNKSIILLSGLRYNGTKACIIAVTQHAEKVLKDYSKKKDFYRIINGLDRDGDGKIDDIEILE
ncbi:MAG: ArsR family transcriptional regulator [archaeon]